MPEAAVNKDRRSPSGEYDVRTPGKLLSVNTIPETEGMNNPSDDNFRRCVLASNEAHEPASLFRGERIHQAFTLILRFLTPVTCEQSSDSDTTVCH
jgi:hypothetical protein